VYRNVETGNNRYYLVFSNVTWAAIAQSVRRLATGWTVHGSNPGGSRSRWPRGFKARVCGRSLARIAGLNPAGDIDVCVVSCK
jgi:hypothetical protein